MVMDAVTLIKNDHRLFERMFDQLRSGGDDRQALLVEMAARLAAHSHAEEMKVYPALAQAEPGEHDEVEHGAEEHHEAEQMLHRLMAMEPDDAEFESGLQQFVDAVLHHVQEEESELLPALQEAVDDTTLEELGQAFEEIRTKELEIAGISSGQSTAAADEPAVDEPAVDEPAVDEDAVDEDEATVDELSRAQLYEQAKQASVPGRSKMSKEELAQALRNES
jgi:hemerythrin superfamily protein